MGEGIEVEESTGKFEVGVGDGTSWVGLGDEAINNVLRPLKSPGDWSSVAVAVAWDEGGSWKPNAASSRSRCIVVTFGHGKEWD